MYQISSPGLSGARQHSTIMELFSTIISPVFSELVIVLRGSEIASLLSDVAFFRTLRRIHRVRPFKLVFLIEDFVPYREEARQELVGALDWVTADGLFDFLESPPNALISSQTPWFFTSTACCYSIPRKNV
jgi:hypothetical protein